MPFEGLINQPFPSTIFDLNSGMNWVCDFCVYTCFLDWKLFPSELKVKPRKQRSQMSTSKNVKVTRTKRKKLLKAMAVLLSEKK